MRLCAPLSLSCLCFVGLAVGCGPKEEASTEPGAAPMQSASSEVLVGCRIEFEREAQRLIACGDRTIMDVRFPEGLAHQEAVMIALGQTLGAISEIQGVTTVPKRLAPVRSAGAAQLSTFALEAEGEDQGKAAPVVILTVPGSGQTRTMWCFPTLPFATPVDADGQWCEQALSAFASGANLMGATMQAASQMTVECPADEDCSKGPTFAESLEGMQKIADKVCACGEDQACQNEARQMMDAWKVGPGMSRDPGTPEQNMQMGQALERMMGCNTPFGLELMAE